MKHHPGHWKTCQARAKAVIIDRHFSSEKCIKKDEEEIVPSLLRLT
jgi:hypothetical protein